LDEAEFCASRKLTGGMPVPLPNFERNRRQFCLLNEMSGCPHGDFSAKLRKIFLKRND
jgi:hypothetical protein